MRFKKTRDVLDHVKSFHEAVSTRYENVASETDRKRLKLLLDYISGREKDLAHAISEFTDETSDQVLNTWFQYTTDDTPIQRLLDSELRPNMTTDDLMRTTMQIADHFITLYREMIDAADTNELREVFQNLLDREQKEKEKVARNFQMFMDI